MESLSREPILSIVLGGVAVHFSFLMVRGLWIYHQFQRVKPTALLTWPARSRNILFMIGLGVLAAGVAVLNGYAHRPIPQIYSQGIMAVYFTLMVPLLHRCNPGLYQDGVWADELHIEPLGEIVREGAHDTERLVYRDEAQPFMPLLGRHTDMGDSKDPTNVVDNILAEFQGEARYSWVKWDDASGDVVYTDVVPVGDREDAPEITMDVRFPGGGKLPSRAEFTFPEKITVRPSSATVRTMASRMSRRTIASRPEEGSSRISSSGRWATAAIRPAWARMPRESSLTFLDGSSANDSSNSRAYEPSHVGWKARV